MTWLERAQELARLLRDPATRARGLEAVEDLARRTARGDEADLRVHDVRIEDLGSLRVLTLPSIFAPEEWGRTFLRGLLARPRESWRGRSIVELGTGSGWVAIALARFTPVAKVYALDLNPHAALVTEINAWVAGVADKVEPGVSDVLATLEERGVKVDLVCGNIPQVLSDPRDLGADEASVLRMLADYTPPTGNYEDVLSLGLIATALERALPRLLPDGRIVLNLAGRPGFDALRWVFARWGYAPRVLHKARVRQDPTTDIRPFARAEQTTGRRFSFFASREDRRPMTAAAAVARRDRGEDVFHDLYVVEGRPYRHLADDGARRLLETDRVPYTADPGTELEGLRDEASIYLACYLRLAARPEEVFVAPDPGEVVEALALASVAPGRLAIAQAWGTDLERAGLRVVTAGAIDEAVLASREAPALVVAALGSRRDPYALGADRLARLADACRQRGAVLVLDATHEPIASTKHAAGPRQQLLDGLWRREDVVVVLDLGEHLSSPGHPLALALVGGRYEALQHVAEATWSRAPAPPQAAYRHLLGCLNERYRGPRTSPGTAPVAPRRPSELARELGRSPAFAPLPRGDDAIRLDFGESEHPVSPRLREGWLSGDANGTEEAAAAFLARTRGGPVGASELAFGRGAQPLVAAAIAAARERGGGRRPLVVLPRPFYGVFPPVVVAARADVAPVTTRLDAAGRLELDLAELAYRIDRANGRPVVLLLANPNNPTGAYAADLERVIAAAHARGAITVVDEVFFTLRHSPRAEAPAGAVAVAARAPELGERLVVVESLSKSFAAGGVRWGVAWTRSRELRDALARAARPPSPRAMAAARAQLSEFEADLAAHVAWLRDKAEQTRRVLGELELDAVPSEGGLFVSADLTSLERPWTGADAWGRVPEVRPDVDDFRGTLARCAGLIVSPDHWSGWALPHRRIVFAIRRLDEALVRLRAAVTVLRR